MPRPARLFAVAMFSAIVAAPALAGELYTINFPTSPSVSSVSSATPFRRDSTYGLPTSNGSSQLVVGGFAGKGFVRARNRIDIQWASGSSGGSSGNMRSYAETRDFVISGPSGGFVTGTLHFRLRANLDKGGGFAGNNGHGASLSVDARVNRLDGATYALTLGSFYFGNFSASGTGCLAAETNPILDVPVNVTGSYPVGVPMWVTMAVEAGGNEYGNVSVSPGYTETDEGGSPVQDNARGLVLEEVGGQVMALPAGYTLNSPSWGVVDNRFASPLAVEDLGPTTDLRLDLAGANPSSGTTRVVLSLPREAEIRVTLFDLAGRAARTLFEGRQPAGRVAITWDGRTASGATAPAGLYFIRAEADGRSVTRAVVRLR